MALEMCFITSATVLVKLTTDKANMTPKLDKAVVAAKAAANAAALNDKDMRFLMALLRSMNDRPDTDWGQVAQDVGLKDSKEQFQALATKFNWHGDGGMSLASTASGSSSPEITAPDAKFIRALFDNMSYKPDVNWDNVVSEYGLVKNIKQAKEKYRVMAWKYSWAQKPGKATPSKQPKTTATPPKQPKATVTVTGKRAAPSQGDDDDVQVPPPSKRARSTSGTPVSSSSAPHKTEEAPFPKPTKKTATAKAADAKATGSKAMDDFEVPKVTPPTKTKAAKTNKATDDIEILEVDPTTKVKTAKGDKATGDVEFLELAPLAKAKTATKVDTNVKSGKSISTEARDTAQETTRDTEETGSSVKSAPLNDLNIQKDIPAATAKSAEQEDTKKAVEYLIQVATKVIANLKKKQAGRMGTKTSGSSA